MPAMLAANMEAINKYIMEAPVRTAKAQAVQIEWIKFWKEHEKSILWYSDDEYDQARNIKHNFDLANATSSSEQQAAKDQASQGLTSEELRGNVRRSTRDGTYIVDDEPFVPTRVTVAAVGILGLIGIGWLGMKYYNLTSPTTYLKKALDIGTKSKA